MQEMKHLRNLLISFVTAWIVSIAGLLCVAYLSNLHRDPSYYTATPILDFVRVLGLFAFFSFVCVGAAWCTVVSPYYFLFLRKSGSRYVGLHAIGAGMVGIVFMIAATHLLPVADDSWRSTAPIAFVVGFLGVCMLRRDAFHPRKKNAQQAAS